MSDRVHKKACLRCGGDMTDSQLARQEREKEFAQRDTAEVESTYAHIRAVVENCKHSPVEAIRHQLVGLLPEVQTFDPDEAQKMREAGHGELVERQEEFARRAWAEFGYGEGDG